MGIVGKKVKHKTFGVGTITDLKDGKITVEFDSKTCKYDYPLSLASGNVIRSDDVELIKQAKADVR